MKGRFFLLLVVLLVLAMSIARADTYTLHTPTKKQVQQDEALEIACNFLHDLTEVEISGIYKVVDGMKIKDKVSAFFGPGYQWGADTNDDCWVMDIRNDSTIGRPWVVIHGTTGEVLYWAYTDKVTNCSYINMLPNEIHLSLADAVQIAMGRFAQVMNEAVPIDINAVHVSSAFGHTGNWSTATVELGLATAWNVNLSYEYSASQYGYFVYIDAENGNILGEQLLGDGAVVLYESYLHCR